MKLTKFGFIYIALFLIFGAPPLVANEFNLMLPDTRPSAPYPNLDNYNSDLTQSGVGLEFNVPVSRHHIIPYNLIRDFYNRVIENRRRQTIIGGFFRNLALNIGWFAFQQDVNCNHPAIYQSLEIASDLSLLIANGQTSNSIGVTTRPDGFDEFSEYYAWLPGNLFIGPTRRGDDPGELFEEDARYIVGEVRFQILSNLRSQMQAYLELGALPESATLPYLRRVAVLLTQLSKRNRVQPLNPTQWKRRSDGSYVIVKNRTSEVKYLKHKADDTPWAKKCLSIRPKHINVILNEAHRDKDEL